MPDTMAAGPAGSQIWCHSNVRRETAACCIGHQKLQTTGFARCCGAERDGGAADPAHQRPVGRVRRHPGLRLGALL